MNIDISLWTNMKRLRERVRNLATMVLSITAMNVFYTISQKAWLFMSINLLFFLSTLPVFMSWSKFQKEPPQEVKE